MYAPRKITATEAADFIARAAAGEDIDNLPFRVLSTLGISAVRKFVNAYTADIYDFNPWYDQAEDAANNAIDGEAIILEIRGVESADRLPHTIMLDEDCFTWQIIDPPADTIGARHA